MGNGERFGKPIGEEALSQNEALRFEPKEGSASGRPRGKRFTSLKKTPPGGGVGFSPGVADSRRR